MEAKNKINSSENIETISVNQLTPADKTYCDTLFAIYLKHVSHIDEILQFIEKKNEQFEISCEKSDNQNLFRLRNLEKAIEALQDELETLTQSLIEKIENYFEKKYCLVFTSLIPERGRLNLDPVSSYDFIIENITGQIDHDLSAAGRQQIIARFLSGFYDTKLPVLKGNKISIPSFICLDEHYGDYVSLSYSHNEGLTNLINAVNLFSNNATELPQVITGKLIEWKSKIDFSQQYQIFPEITLKFYKNRRIDLLFDTPTTARRFWNYYRLEIIGKIIIENY